MSMKKGISILRSGNATLKVSGRTDQLLRALLNGRGELIDDVEDGAVEYGRGGKAIGPGRARRIDGGEVPQVATPVAAVLNGLRRAGIPGHLSGQHMLGIPI